ncbi:hypothetical protein ACWEKM_31660 [Streptomyces sp. NPDC004752]
MNCTDSNCSCCGSTATEAPILVTINPEARVNVTRVPVALPEIRSGEWTAIPISVVNEGYTTGALVIEASPVMGIEFDDLHHVLTGRNQEIHLLVRFDEAATVEIELRFLAAHALGGLSLHDTIPLILRCERTESPVHTTS